MKLLALPFTERTLLGARTYYCLFIGLGLVFVMYGLTLRSVFFFLQHTERNPLYVWIAFVERAQVLTTNSSASGPRSTSVSFEQAGSADEITGSCEPCPGAAQCSKVRL